MTLPVQMAGPGFNPGSSSPSINVGSQVLSWLHPVAVDTEPASGNASRDEPVATIGTWSGSNRPFSPSNQACQVVLGTRYVAARNRPAFSSSTVVMANASRSSVISPTLPTLAGADALWVANS